MCIDKLTGQTPDPVDVSDGARRLWPSPMLIDAHTHLYDCYDLATYFDATLANIRRAKEQFGLYLGTDPDKHTPACLMLTEPAGIYAFESLRQQGELDGGRWRFIPCEEDVSLIAQCDGRDELVLIEGRQIQTTELLEVLSLCCDKVVPDWQYTTEEVLGRVIEHGGMPVLPLGVGKWWWSRGRVIDRVLNGPFCEKLYLGDNAGRLAMGPTPRHFIEARKRGVWILPGSGALPFKSQMMRVGRYGLVLEHRIDRAEPAASIKRAILAGGEQPVIYGRPDGLANFLKLQIGIQIRNFLKRSSEGPPRDT